MPTETGFAAVHMPKDAHIDIVDSGGVNAAHAIATAKVDQLRAGFCRHICVELLTVTSDMLRNISVRDEIGGAASACQLCYDHDLQKVSRLSQH